MLLLSSHRSRYFRLTCPKHASFLGSLHHNALLFFLLHSLLLASPIFVFLKLPIFLALLAFCNLTLDVVKGIKLLEAWLE
jgi:hypothetical protein